MKTIEVAAAIIIRGGRALATQRGYGELKGGGGNSQEASWSQASAQKMQSCAKSWKS